MKINAINNQNFEARRFRLTVKKMDLTNPDLIQYGRQFKSVNFVKEYSNPEAESLYKKAIETKDMREKARLLSEMDDFELIDFGPGVLGKMRMNLYLAISKVTDLFS